MKSVITQGSTIAKAIEEALKKSDSPQEFFVKILEDAQPGFLGFGAKKAKIALFFKDGNVSEKEADSMLAKGSYLGLFNNPSIKKQIDQQLKELGLEIKPIKNEQVEKKPAQTNSNQHSKMQVRPLNPKPQQHYKQQENQQKKEDILRQPQEETLQQYVSKQFNSPDFKDQTNFADQKKDENQSGQNRRRRYYRYRRNRHRNRNDQQQEGSSTSFGSDIDNFKKDE